MSQEIELRSVGGVEVDYTAVLQALNLNPRDPKVQALVLTCQQYGLDPVLKHMILISGDAYITHKGLLHVAHMSGRFDGIELLDQGETGDDWWAKVAVWRNDMAHPFTYVGRYPKGGTNRKYGPEMAITRAETMALRRAFDIAAPVQEEQDWPTPPARTHDLTAGEASDNGDSPAGGASPAGSPSADDLDRESLRGRIARLTAEFVDKAKAGWTDHQWPALASEALTAEHVTTIERFLADVEKQQKQTHDRRRKHIRAKLGEAGVKDEADVDALILSATTAIGQPTDSTAALSEAQVAAIVDQLKPLIEGRLAEQGSDAA